MDEMKIIKLKTKSRRIKKKGEIDGELQENMLRATQLQATVLQQLNSK